jgi:hypothetical protein
MHRFHLSAEHRFFLNSVQTHHYEQKDSRFFLFPDIDILSIHATPSRCTISTESNIPAFSPPNNVANGQEKQKRKPNIKPEIKTKTKPYVRHTPFTPNWIVDRLQDSPDRAIPLLRDWAHPKRRQEINSSTIGSINDMKPNEAVEAINELKTPRRYIRGTSTNRLAVSTVIKNPDSGNEFKTKTLIDCGCKGSVIDKQFIEEQGIQTKKL